MAAGRQRGGAGFRAAPGRGLGWCGAGSRVRRRAGSFPPASSRPDHAGRAAFDMQGRRFGWKWGLLVGAPMAALPRSAFTFAARQRLRHAEFGGHAPACCFLDRVGVDFPDYFARIEKICPALFRFP